MAKASAASTNGDGYDGSTNKKQQGFKRSKGGCLNCKFRKVKCDELKPSCSACRRLAMPCGNYGATLSKSAYAEQKQDFLEQVRRKGAISQPRVKRSRKSVSMEEDAEREQLHMQLQLGIAMPNSDDELHASLAPFNPTVAQDFYVDPHAYDPQPLEVENGESTNLFEINPTAAIQQLQQANRDQDLVSASLSDATYANPDSLSTSPPEPYVPSLMSLDKLMNQQHHEMRAEQQRAAEEAAVRARKDETLAQQRRLQESTMSIT